MTLKRVQISLEAPAADRCSLGRLARAESVDARRLRPQLFSRGADFVLVIVRSAEEGHFIEHMLLKPFEPEIDDWRHKKRDELGENQTTDDHQSQRPARCGILAESERDRDCAHERGESSHHYRTKPFYAGFVNGRAQVPPFVDSLQRKIDHHNSVLLHDA